MLAIITNKKFTFEISKTDKTRFHGIYFDIFAFYAILKNVVFRFYNPLGGFMKYISIILLVLFSTVSLANTEQPKPQSVHEFCQMNPNHERSKLIATIFKDIKPCSKVSRWWRIFTGKRMFLPVDFQRHYFLISCEDIGQELNWDKEKIDEEFNKLCTEADLIRNS
jgi:hypothetical protein